MRGDQFVRDARLKRRMTGEEFVREAAEGVDVGAVVHGGIARRLLWRHVRRRADTGSGLRDRGRERLRARDRNGLRDAEVGDYCRSARKEHVLRLDVAVHDAGVVRVGERARHVPEDANCFGDREPPAFREPLTEREPLDKRHRIEGELARVPGREERHDVRLLQPGGELNLARETLGSHVGREFGMQHLHDHGSAERDFGGDEDARHPAAREFAFDTVGVSECGLELVAEGSGHEPVKATAREVRLAIPVRAHRRPCSIPGRRKDSVRPAAN